jgi:hypothetical protein
VKEPVIAPGKGCEHFAQKGDRIRGAFSAQLPHRHSPGSIAPAQTAQKGG